jgi:hypothetical protein
MAISTAAELSTAISNWLDVTSTQFATNQLTDLAMLGEKWIMRNVRNEDMESSMSTAISSGVLTAPTGFLGWKYAYIDGTPVSKLEVRTPEQIIANYPTRSSSGKPKWIAYDAGSFIFGPYPDSTYTVKGTYYKKQGPLSSAVYNLFTNNPDLYLFAALAEAEIVIGRDQRIQIWTAKRNEIAQAINTEAKGIATSGGMAMTPA